MNIGLLVYLPFPSTVIPQEKKNYQKQSADSQLPSSTVPLSARQTIADTNSTIFCLSRCAKNRRRVDPVSSM